jgi:hypothetical protein
VHENIKNIYYKTASQYLRLDYVSKNLGLDINLEFTVLDIAQRKGVIERPLVTLCVCYFAMLNIILRLKIFIVDWILSHESFQMKLNSLENL